MPENNAAVEPKTSTWQEVISFIKTLAIILVIALFLRASVVEAYKIPSGSMIPTLLIGDHILVTKYNYGLWLPFLKTSVQHLRAPKRGDIVVFTRPDNPRTPENESADNIIKRVIGEPGDVVEVRGSQVYINGAPLDEPYAVWDLGGAMDFGPEKVPDDSVFLMGDNRDHSKDSRFWENPQEPRSAWNGPYLNIRRIKGRAQFIYWNFANLGRIGKAVR